MVDINSIIERVRPFSVPIVLGVIGFGFVVYGFMSLSQPQKKEEIVFHTASDVAQPEKSVEKKITIDIEGAVVKPGVYSLPAESRMQDALLAAGGMHEHAERSFVAKTLNLAAKLTDGAKVYIPFAGETITTSEANGAVAGASTININTVSASELDKLPGIGEVTAQKIIGARPYASVDELLAKKVVSKKVFDQIKEKVSTF